MHKVLILTLSIILASGWGITNALAGELGSKQVVLTSGNTGAINVGYTFTFNPATTGLTIRCILLQTQTPQGTSALPNGMDLSNAGGGTTTGLNGLTYAADTSGAAAGIVKYTNASGPLPSNPISLNMTGVGNPTTDGTYFFRIRTFSNTDCSTAARDIDTVAFVIAPSNVTVTGSVGETLSFSLASTSASLGTLSSASVQVVDRNLTVVTNATNGYGINASGTTLSKGADTIPFVTDGTIITPGNSLFGLRVFTCASGASCNNTQDIGSGLVGGITDLMSRTGPTTGDTHTVRYRASINASTPAGAYSAAISYVAVGKF